ncbi:MAG: thioredoxin [Planctomycetota bacterium]|jgi:putative thioredoxin
MTTQPPAVIDVTAASFFEQVVERSKQVPVLVDFWAEWCGPCQTLGPMLERLAEEYAGRFVLAKVNTDVEQQIAGELGIQSLPTVVLVMDGKQVDGFRGALPEPELRKFLETHIGGADGASPATEARNALDEGRVDEALAILEGLYSESPNDDDIKLLLARACIESGDKVRAEGILDLLGPASADSAEARALRAKLTVETDPGVVGALEAKVRENPDDLSARIKLGRALAGANRIEEGLEMILATIEVDRDHDDQAGRRAMVELLDLLGADSDVAHSFRQRLQVAMYV